MNCQLYQGSGRTKKAARRDAVRRALSCSVQLPDVSIVRDMDMVVHTTTDDFTEDSVDQPLNAQNMSVTSEDVFRRTSPAWRLPSFLSASSHSKSTNAGSNDTARHTSPLCATSTDISSSRRRPWFNAAAVLHDVRPSARYHQQTSPNNGVVCATVTVDEQRFEGSGATWRAAKRNAASRALRHILQLRHLTSDF